MRLVPLLLSGLFLMAAPPAPMAPAELPVDVQQAPSCRHCGMDRGLFSQSRTMIEYEDGSVAANCSLHCAAVELAVTIDKIPVMLRVADYESRELLDAEQAVWVMGGMKKGVMTAQAKWAFADRAAAERFIQANGGRLASFDEAIKAAYDDMYQDAKMIREFRKMKQRNMSVPVPQ
jgi:copper chaperone NosL